MMQKAATGTYTMPDGTVVTIYNPECYLTWANGQIIRVDGGGVSRCTDRTERTDKNGN